MSTQIPHTKTVVSYAYTITANGTSLGTLQGFNPSSTRALERVRELRNEIDDMVEIVPGRSEFTIQIDKLEMYSENVLQALGFSDFEDISKLRTPIQIVETIKDPVSGKGRTVSYVNCWIQNVAKTIREGTITVSETVTLWPEKIITKNTSNP